jgi:hypothetical protein
MQGEQCHNKRALPERPGHSIENKKQQQRARRVKHHVCQMVRPGVHAEKLHVQHVRKPRQGMPVAGVSRGKGPNYVSTRQTTSYVRVLADVVGIVIAHKVVAEHLCVDNEDHNRQNQTEPELTKSGLLASTVRS